jgi:hypothetical protein
LRPLHWFSPLPIIKKISPAFSACLYFTLAAALAFHCYRNSILDIDFLSFAGNAALAETPDLEKAHALVYTERLTPHLKGTDADDTQAKSLRRRASDTYYWALYLPYFSVKPLYLNALEGVHQAGANLVDSARIVSALSFFLIAGMVWLYTRSPLAILVLLLPEVTSLGALSEPDGLSTALLLAGLWLAFLKRVDLGVLPLITSVWVRPDNAILCLLVLAWLWHSNRLNWLNAAALGLLVVGSEGFISHFGYGWKALYFHTFLGGSPDEPAHFAATDYLHAAGRGAWDVLHSTVPISVLLWATSLVCVRERGFRDVLCLAGLFSLVRFVMYPNYEPRYYGLYFILTGAAAISCIQDRLSRWKENE